MRRFGKEHHHLQILRDILEAVRNAGGDESEIAGNITKQQLGQIYHYTLNWASGQKPAKGSYQLWGGISGESSAAATIKIP